MTRLARTRPLHGQRPSPDEEGTRYPRLPWDLRTLIAVFPEDSPFRFLNVNTVLGLTGTPFDQVEAWDGAPEDAFDAQLCLEGRGRVATYKRYHRVSEEVRFTPRAVQIELEGRVSWSGSWPDYRITWRQPEVDLELDVRLSSWPGFMWWARLPRAYCHYTTFAGAHVTWRWGDDAGELELPVLQDHGYGKHLLPLRVPLRRFRYEVLRLPDGGHLISLETAAPGGIRLVHVSAHRSAGPAEPLVYYPSYRARVHTWDVYADYAGHPRRVPRRWTGHLEGPAGTFSYEAERTTEPRPVIGDGFFYGCRYQGQGRGALPASLHGEGYVEQLGAGYAPRGAS